MQESDTVLEFCSITGADLPIARSYLEAAAGHLDLAVQLYLDEGPKGPSEVPQELPSESRVRKRDLRETMDDEDHQGRGLSSGPSHLPQQHELTDEEDRDDEMGRDVEEASTSSNSSSIPSRGLSGQGVPLSRPSVTSHPWAQPISGAFGPGVLRDVPSGGTGFLSTLEARPGLLDPAALRQQERIQRLSELFRPPLELIFRGSIEEARASGRSQGRWILLNAQDMTEFACQTLNRDLWSHSEIKALIRESFIFMQLDVGTGQGQRYRNFYPFTGYPHIAILDPRTGERVKVWSRSITPEEFLQDGTYLIRPNDDHLLTC